jgi:hypothetical protein
MEFRPATQEDLDTTADLAGYKWGEFYTALKTGPQVFIGLQSALLSMRTAGYRRHRRITVRKLDEGQWIVTLVEEKGER